ncbi:MAG: AEC family transporter [Ruminococcaceae bacterium]|jgi:predicted permease|nr:AEC family transporter [Oscillospiraceae bacterium]
MNRHVRDYPLFEQFSITALQLIKLFSFIAAGYLLRRLSLLPDQTGIVLSKLEVYLFLPALCFRTMANNFRPSVIKEQSTMLLISLAVLSVTFLLSRLLARFFTADKNIREVYSYSFTIPNLGYLGYPLVLALFGELTLFHFMVFTIPYSIFIYTVGIYILNPNRSWSFKSMINPSMIALFLGIAAGLGNIRMPSVVMETMDLASDCMAPVAMLLTGFVLGAFLPGRLLGRLKVHVATWIRLIVLPLGVFAALRLFQVNPDTIMLAVILLAMPFGLNTVIFTQTTGGDSTEGAQLTFVSYIYSLFTVPLVISLLLHLLGYST